MGVAGAALVAGVVAAMPRTRPAVAALAVVALGISLIPQPAPGGPELAVLDVGQGDAILLR
ncbi:MAG: hypothetical protein GWN48_26625, partial [Actinobacteria bacterium]|nr:hypothetical protein [Actinomycetota bacterium]